MAVNAGFGIFFAELIILKFSRCQKSVGVILGNFSFGKLRTADRFLRSQSQLNEELSYFLS